MEEEILDQSDEQQEEYQDQRLRWRAFRMFMYSIGIGLLMYIRLRGFDAGFSSEGVSRLLLLGVAGIWLFSGLGVVAIVQAIRLREPADWMMIVAAVGNGLLLLISSSQLINHFLL